MSDQTVQSTESTQPTKAAKKKFRVNWRGLFLGIFGLIVLVALGGLGGYYQGLGDRANAEATVVSKQTTEQFALALVDIQNKRYEDARQRLEYIIQKDPTFPGASDKLAQVMVLASIPTATVTPTLTPTVDLSGVEEIFQRAQQYLNAGDWQNTLNNLDTLRKKDSTYRTAEVDGMYYFALRNYGVDQIKQGDLEGGIYELTLAERFGPLDNTASGLRDAARAYVLAASFWGLDWKNAASYFSQVYAGWPSLWDGTMTASERYRVATERYGDDLFAQDQYCAATQQYQISAGIGPLDGNSIKYANQSYQKCYPPTEVPPPVIPPISSGTP